MQAREKERVHPIRLIFGRSDGPGTFFVELDIPVMNPGKKLVASPGQQVSSEANGPFSNFAYYLDRFLESSLSLGVQLLTIGSNRFEIKLTQCLAWRIGVLAEHLAQAIKAALQANKCYQPRGAELILITDDFTEAEVRALRHHLMPQAIATLGELTDRLLIADYGH
jgi:hypothetical protein